MYIVLEGIVWCGKSTQTHLLVAALQARFPDREIIQVREPGTTPISEDIRALAQGKEWENEVMHPLTNTYLYAAARAQTLHTVVAPALARGALVISDRSFLSSLAYQWEAQRLGFEKVLEVNQAAVSGLLPDLVLYLELDVDRSLARTFDSVGDKWEKMGRDFFVRIQRGYDRCYDLYSDRMVRIDASGTKEAVHSTIMDALISRNSL